MTSTSSSGRTTRTPTTRGTASSGARSRIEEWITAIQAAAADSGRTLDLTPLQSLLGQLTVHDDVVAHIRGLRADGYRTALVTNNVPRGLGDAGGR